jgi:3-isopropylmalate dehydrogenase
MVPGDGIGIDVTREAVKVLEAASKVYGFGLTLEHFDYGAERYLKTGETLPEGALATWSEFDAIFMGAFGDPRVPDMKHAADILLGTRFKMDLYANVRPVRCLTERLCPLRNYAASDIDFVVFRENTEGAYAGIGGIFKKGTPDEIGIQEDINTRKGVERIVRAAFAFAASQGRTKVTMSDKSNALRHAHDLWQRVFAEVAAEYPGIQSNHLYVDALTMQLIKDPRQFEVIVTCNMFGDIVTDLGAALQGGLGMAASGNIHPGKTSMFEPVRAQVRGNRHREPVRRDPDRGDDARTHGAEGRGPGDRGRGRRLSRGKRVHGRRRGPPRGESRRRRRRDAAEEVGVRRTG